MEKKTIAHVKELFEQNKLTENEIELLKKDNRKGVQQLIKSYERKQSKRRKLEKDFLRMNYYENEAYEKGYKLIAGIDEAGRGPLAGPVVAAAVILPRDFELLGLTDSKLLNEEKRNEFYDIIIDQSISYGITIINNEEIDKINILEATKKAMYSSVEKLSETPDYILIDAVELEDFVIDSKAIIKGDLNSITIAAASVLAKVTRDRLMREIHDLYPVYEFDSNMGYGTKKHLEMLNLHGSTPYHRKSFGPVRNHMND